MQQGDNLLAQEKSPSYSGKFPPDLRWAMRALWFMMCYYSVALKNGLFRHHQKPVLKLARGPIVADFSSFRSVNEARHQMHPNANTEFYMFK